MLGRQFSVMAKKAFFLFGFCIFAIMVSVKAGASEKGIFIEYTVNIKEEEPDHIHIKTRIWPVPTAFLRLSMTQNYGQAKKLEEVIPEISVYGAGRKLSTIKKTSEFLWVIDLMKHDDIVIDYAVNTRYPFTSLNSVRLPYRDADHLYFPAASVFIHPDEKYLDDNNVKIRRIRVNFDLPKGWIAATSWGTGRSSYDLSPPSCENLNFGLIGAGHYRVYSFLRVYSLKDKALPIDIALLNPGPVPDEEIIRVVDQALSTGDNLFGFFPVPRLFALFHFIFDHPGQGSANALGWSVNLNYSRNPEAPDRLKEKAHIFHEIFHFWNGTEGGPISRAQSDHSLIWFTEGITRFYQYKNMLRSGVISEEKYFQYLSGEFSDVYVSARREDSLNKISVDYYSDPNAMALTYSKGCCLAFALDLLLRHSSAGRINFDAVMQKMLERYDFRLNRHCYSHEELNGVFREILENRFYPSYERLYGKDFVREFESILDLAGLQIEKRKGSRLYFGIIDFGPPSGPLKAFVLDRESPAYKAGLREEDVLLEINSLKVNDISDIKKALDGKDEGESVALVIERKGQIKKLLAPWASYATSFNIRRKNAKDLK
jgi:predicted metalloprotease with PDZ domain